MQRIKEEGVGFSEGYGLFPYVIWRVSNNIYMQIPIGLRKKNGDLDQDTPNKKRLKMCNENESSFRDIALKIKESLEEKKGETCKVCLVLGPEKAFYFTEEKETLSSAIPSGGVLMDQKGNSICINKEHFIE